MGKKILIFSISFFLIVVVVLLVYFFVFYEKNCVSNSDCLKKNQICGPKLKCINNCVKDGCELDQTCNLLSGLCDQKCSSLNPCSNGSVCNDITGFCNETCNVKTDCRSGFDCVGKRCTKTCSNCMNGQLGGCAEGKNCVDGACITQDSTCEFPCMLPTICVNSKCILPSDCVNCSTITNKNNISTTTCTKTNMKCDQIVGECPTTCTILNQDSTCQPGYQCNISAGAKIGNSCKAENFEQRPEGQLMEGAAVRRRARAKSTSSLRASRARAELSQTAAFDVRRLDALAAKESSLQLRSSAASLDVRRLAPEIAGLKAEARAQTLGLPEMSPRRALLDGTPRSRRRKAAPMKGGGATRVWANQKKSVLL